MKAIKLIFSILLLSFVNPVLSQVSVNVNIGTPPAWAPVGYNEVEYYYLPDVEAYYDVRTSQFIYLGGGKWVRSRYLPRAYRGYDLYSGYKVVLTDYHGNSPYVYFKDHKVKYHKGYKGAPQKTIGVRGKYHGNNGNHGNGKHKGHKK